jgi:FkbM family methyltransferase
MISLRSAIKGIYGVLPMPGKRRISVWRHERKLEKFRQSLRRIATTKRNPFFVKVGAHDGYAEDPCADLLFGSTDWRGLLIEPVPAFAARLRERFGDQARFQIEEVAVGPEAGRAPFYFVKEEAEAAIPDLPGWYDQLSSFDRTHIEKHLDGVLTPFIGTMEVLVKPLGEILMERGIREIDFLHVDTEGYDWVVLQTIDLSSCRPSVVFVEHKHLSPNEVAQMRGLLRRHGYRVVDCGGDFFAERETI